MNASIIDGAYDILLQKNHRLPVLLDGCDRHSWYHESPYDPFEDSENAVYSYQHGDLLTLCEHNLADVHRTWELAELVREFVPPKDITEKKL